MEEPEKALEWLTTGIGYLLPKEGENKEVRNYQPMTFLTTRYTTLIYPQGSLHIWKRRAFYKQSKSDVTLEVKVARIK
jgi:hypothetical protein